MRPRGGGALIVPVTARDTHRTIDAVWKLESARIVAALTRMVREVGLAEELAQDALVAALEQWPEQGVPDNPGAWIMTAAKRRAIDHLRRTERLERRQEQLAHELSQDRDGDAGTGDDVLRLMFVSCHPVLPAEERVALTLRLLAGLTAEEIARAFLVSEQAVVQRVARAKQTLADARIPFELPPGAELADRLSSVLEVVYLVFNEGYSATSGEDLIRPTLCLEALRLGRLLAELAPAEPEVHGLVALMEIQASRSAARTGPSGEPLQLHEQNRGRWDPLLIRRGMASLLRARESSAPPGPYVLQAAIAATHARARTVEETDWAQIAALYDALIRVAPTPVVQLNRAVAIGMTRGPQAALDVVDVLKSDPALRNYHLLPSVRADLLAKLGRHAEARTEFERAASLARNAAERAFLLRRAADLPALEDEGVTLAEAVRDFLARDELTPATRRSYTQTLHRLCLTLGDGTPLTSLTPERVAQAFAISWPATAPKTWNRHRSAVRSFSAWSSAPPRAWLTADLSTSLDRRPEPRLVTASLHPSEVELLLARSDASLRERALWRLLYESSATVTEALSLDVEDLGLRHRPGHLPPRWDHATTELLSRLTAGRSRGPVFLSDRRPAPSRTPSAADLCPETGRRRLSYERAEYLFKQATKSLDPSGRGYTLHQLRHARPR
ncbi:sigma-70 family RNA polymerase sigma factor [Actinocorallia sp. B10E7]|uniref:sigma-70 family RNA polymerase sigma factor n=1 Tax=Actinocorallia sp. B10E7 TaxID=3153558 RepID=UPI00325E0AF5